MVGLDSDGLKIKITNCPYRLASVDDEIICTVDRSTVSILLGNEAECSVEI